MDRAYAEDCGSQRGVGAQRLRASQGERGRDCPATQFSAHDRAESTHAGKGGRGARCRTGTLREHERERGRQATQPSDQRGEEERRRRGNGHAACDCRQPREHEPPQRKHAEAQRNRRRADQLEVEVARPGKRGVFLARHVLGEGRLQTLTPRAAEDDAGHGGGRRGDEEIKGVKEKNEGLILWGFFFKKDFIGIVQLYTY